MGNTYDMVMEAASFIEKEIEHKPDLAIILGSGLGELISEAENTKKILYENIPGFVKTTVPGHKGTLSAGMLEGKYILSFSGRFHHYEGYDIDDIVFPVRMLAALGIKNIIITNSAGGINSNFSVGDIMLIKDHISFFAKSPLIGKNDDRLGVRFPDMTYAYSPNLLKLAATKAVEYGIKAHEGVYAYTTGPTYETPAEIRALLILGADAVGMSTVPEVIAANHAGMKVLGISLITNKAAGLNEQVLNHKDVVKAAADSKEKISILIKMIIRNMI